MVRACAIRLNRIQFPQVSKRNTTSWRADTMSKKSIHHIHWDQDKLRFLPAPWAARVFCSIIFTTVVEYCTFYQRLFGAGRGFNAGPSPLMSWYKEPCPGLLLACPAPFYLYVYRAALDFYRVFSNHDEWPAPFAYVKVRLGCKSRPTLNLII